MEIMKVKIRMKRMKIMRRKMITQTAVRARSEDGIKTSAHGNAGDEMSEEEPDETTKRTPGTAREEIHGIHPSRRRRPEDRLRMKMR